MEISLQDYVINKMITIFTQTGLSNSKVDDNEHEF